MKQHIRLFSILAALAGLAACVQTQDKARKLEVSIVEPAVTFDAGSVFVRVSSDVDWTLAFANPVDWATLNTTSGTGDKNSVIIEYDANEEPDDRSVTVVALSSDGALVSEATLTQAGYSVDAPEVPTNANDGVQSTAPFNWLELPATDASDGKDFIWHYIRVGANSIRNFSYYWDYSNLVAFWVAYPLTDSYINKYAGSMPYRWGLEPLLPRDKQSVLTSGFRTGNHTVDGAFYARGHQIALADRKITAEANIQTCYGTNMTPQLNKSDYGSGAQDFNGGIWASLESRVRDWASSSDTLYVVTGCTVAGSTYYALDNDGKKVTVPSGYFKAVLRYAPSSTVGHDGYMGCAVYLDHKLYSSSAKVDKSYAMSIDELEKKLGIDLFVNLPSVVGDSLAATIEAEDPKSVNWWW
ncbi:MAG: DNA/RNA non-specific endonuclease [Bacteroidales bacterium]|nr:DNA/RNA non-specific endonuclease [Bacteroidales bacterium]